MFRVLAPLTGLLFVVLLFAAIPPHHGVTVLQLRTILVHTVIVAVAGLGMTMVIASGGIDLSIGSGVALAGVTGALALDHGWPLWGAVLASLATGTACGLYNGVLITALRLPPFIATLGTLGFFRGVAKWIAGSSPISPSDMHGFNTFLQPQPPENLRWMIVAPGVWLLLLLALGVAGLMRSTVFGRNILAIGGNETAARYAGISIRGVKTAAYALAGLFVGLAGLLQLSRLTQGDPTVAAGLELDVIAAVVIGGASLAGGTASIAGTPCGALMNAYLNNRCSLLGWPTFVQQMIVGHIIIAAVSVDLWRRRRS
ncbi:MAG: Ribose import permease protein RbsC [Phycisphaerales bacterium]|nr:Ribose import permease protein RbsC [Phycisphaerales bacterium]